MWVDDYNVGKDSTIRETWRDYVATHTPVEIIWRWLRGFWGVYIRVPLLEEVFPILYVIAVPGAVIAILRFRDLYPYLLLLAFILLLPLVWIHVSDPTGRIPYSVLFPFELIFAGLALDSLRTA